MDIDSRPDPDVIAALREALHADDQGESALGWAGVHAFEAAHGVTVPEPYRTFVAEVSDGSFAGPPDYGLVALADLPDDWGAGRPERDLARPFPLTAEWLWEEEEDADEDRVERVFNDGSIVLGTDGCGMYWHLVVSGPHRGHVWMVSGEGAVPFGSAFGRDTGEPGFAGWVRHWATGRGWFDAS
ncbi:SMI1/KNR4 family protein [Actinoplanes sp. NPDC023714]|uniref:SMI1/KNR4 family protein n=1 Tax=Actinoplanes sp. NPDC023714 TaxID=3154322 RepID=UPI0033EBBD5E